MRFIKHAQALGFTLAEVEDLLPLRQASLRRKVGLEVRDVDIAKIGGIDEKLQLLDALRSTLVDLVAECDTTCGADADSDEMLSYPIIAALDAPDTEAGARQPSSRARSQSARAR